MTYNHKIKIDNNDISFSSAYESDYMLFSDDENNVIAIDITSDEVKDRLVIGINKRRSAEAIKRDVKDILWQMYIFYESRSVEKMGIIPEKEFNKEYKKLNAVYEVIRNFDRDWK